MLTPKFARTPHFTDVYQSVEASEPGNDGWAIKEGLVRYVSKSSWASLLKLTSENSVTPLKANFMHVQGLQGEVKL